MVDMLKYMMLLHGSHYRHHIRKKVYSMNDKIPYYAHCGNCKWNKKGYYDYNCEIKHTKSSYYGRLRALFCRFFCMKEENEK